MIAVLVGLLHITIQISVQVIEQKKLPHFLEQISIMLTA